MGVVKYKNLGLDYPLKDVPAATKDEAIKAREIILEGAREGRHAEFAGTLCQIAALKSLRGDTLDNIAVFPVFCDDEQRRSNPACAVCKFYE